MSDDIIEGEATALVERETAQPVQVFNPLDAPEEQFKRQLAVRQKNYDALRLHLRDTLVPDKDFARLHVASKAKCPKPWECSPQKNRGHWSDWQLLAAGADKVLGILGLGVHYPDLQDYKRAALKGYDIKDVVIDCHIVDQGGQVIAEGMGGCSRTDANMDGDLNRTLKRACKRARVDAVHRLPVVSALFEADFLADIEKQAAKTGGNTVNGRARQPSQQHNTGARLTAMPFGKHQGKPFRELPDDYLEWILTKCSDKPDVAAAARRELNKRSPDSGQDEKTAPAASQAVSDSADPLEEYMNGAAPVGREPEVDPEFDDDIPF